LYDHQKTKNEEEKNDFREDDHFCRVSSFSSFIVVLLFGGKSDAHRSGMFRMSSRGGERLMFRI